MSSLVFALLYNSVDLREVSIATGLLLDHKCTLNPCCFTVKLCDRAISTIKTHGDDLFALRCLKAAEAEELPDGDLSWELNEALSDIDTRLGRFATVKDYLTRVK